MEYIRGTRTVRYGGIPEQIRRHLGSKMFEKSDLQISVEKRESNEDRKKGKNAENINLVFDGDLTLEIYREYFPNVDNYATVYLTLEPFDIRVAEAVASFCQNGKEKIYALARADYKETKETRKLTKNARSLSSIIMSVMNDVLREPIFEQKND